MNTKNIKIILISIVCLIATISFFSWVIGSVQTGPTHEEIYISTLETKLLQLGSDWDIQLNQSIKNNAHREIYKGLYEGNLSIMYRLNQEADTIRQLLNPDFRQSANLSN